MLEAGANDLAKTVTGAADDALANAPGSSPENPVLVDSIEAATALRAGHEAGHGPWVRLSRVGDDQVPRKFDGADLSGANLTRIDFNRASLKGANLTNAKLEDSDLSRTNLSGANLKKAQADNAKFAEANLEKA